MAVNSVTLVQATQLPNAVAAQYTCPAASRVTVGQVVFTNTTGGTVNATAYLVPSGGSVTDAAKLLDAYPVGAHTAYIVAELAGVVMNSGDKLECFASAATSISMNASGIIQT